MENRFGFKDLILLVAVVGVVVIVLLQMQQTDRQWDQLQKLNQQSEDQARLLSSISRSMNDISAALSGQANAPSNPATTQATPSTNSTIAGADTHPHPISRVFPHGDPFANLKEAQKNSDFARGDWLIDNTGAKLKTVCYPVASDLYAAWVQARVLEGLIYRDPMTLEYRPQLARDWQISPDGLTYTFELRKGVLFSDGVPVTADDVIYSFTLLMDPKVNCPRLRGYLENIKSVEKKGDDVIVFTMKQPYYDSLDLCGTLNIIPQHFLSKFSQEEINTNPGLLMGTGPYRLVDPQSWRPGEKMQLVRNDLYWGEPGTFDRNIFLEVEEEAAEETMFGNGELDVFAPPPQTFQRLLNDPNTAKHANHFEVESPMNGYAFVAWNEKRDGKKTVFADPRVRRAMTMLTDRQRICHEVFLDYAKPTSGPFAMNSPQADAAIAPWPFDVAAAKALLKEAGFTDRDGSGVLKDESGGPLKFRLTYASGNATFERVVLFLKDTYSSAGVTLEPDPVDWPILQKKLDQRDFDAITLSWGGSLESDLYQEFHSSQMADQGDDFMSYSNPKLDAVVEEARHTVDAPARMKLWHQAHAILHEDQPYTFLFSRMSLRFMDKRVQNVHPSKVGLNYVYLYSMPDPWYVPTSMQKYRMK